MSRKRSPSEERESDLKRRAQSASEETKSAEEVLGESPTAAPSRVLLDSPQEQYRQGLGDVSGEVSQQFNPDDFLSEQFKPKAAEFEEKTPEWRHPVKQNTPGVDYSSSSSNSDALDDYLSSFSDNSTNSNNSTDSNDSTESIDLALLEAQQSAQSGLFFSEILEEILENRNESAGLAGSPSQRIDGLDYQDIRFLNKRRPIGYTVTNNLGMGAFGAVVKAEVIPHGGYVAIKVYTIGQSQANIPSINREVRILRRLRERPHKNILKFFACFKHPKYDVYYLVSQYTPLIDLYEALQVTNQSGNSVWMSLDEAPVRHLSREIAEGLIHLHANGIAHCDLKLENVLVFWKSDTNDAQKMLNVRVYQRLVYQWQLKLADFNNSMMRNSGVGQEGKFWADIPRCTIYYAAPESWSSNPNVPPHYDLFTADSYSLGCCIIALALSARPFDPYNPFEAKWPKHNDADHDMKRLRYIKGSNAMKIDKSYVEHLCRHFSPQMKRVVLKLLDPNPQTRLTVNQFLSDPWITSRHSYEDIDAYKQRPKPEKPLYSHEYH